MKMNKNIYPYVLAVLMLLGASAAYAQSIELLGLPVSNHTAQLKAKVELGGKQIKDVTTYTFRMTDGKYTTRNSYELVEDKYITADVNYQPGNYAYRMEVTLTDDSKILSECIDETFTESFMWLGDLTFSDFKSGWDANHPPRVDGSVDPTMKLILNDTLFYKGVSNHAEGYIAYEFDRPFSRFVTRFGVREDHASGDVNFQFLKDNVQVHEKLMYSKANPNRGGQPCIADIDIDMNGAKQLRINALQYDNNQGDHAHLVMSRLYTPCPIQTEKQPQQVYISTQGGAIPENTERITLAATATSGGNVHFKIIKGQELGTIENGNVLVPKRAWGQKGEIIVEATQYGDGTYALATAYIRFTIDMAPNIEFLSSFPSVQSADERVGYLLIDTKGRRLVELKLQAYDNANTLTPTDTKDLLPLLSDMRSGMAQIIEYPVRMGSQGVQKLTYRYEGDTESTTTPYQDGVDQFDYMSDIEHAYQPGYGTARVDTAYNNEGPLRITDHIYKKGFGIHGPGWVETRGDLSAYDRFVTAVGGQKISNPARGKIDFSLLIGTTTMATTGNITDQILTEWDYPINHASKVRINIGQGGDNNQNDVAAIGGARFYYPVKKKQEQSISWKQEKKVIHNQPFKMELDATASSGLPLAYRVKKGSEYACIENKNTLNFTKIPEQGEVVVEAYQPGDATWASSSISQCVFRMTKGIVVQKGQRVELDGGQELEEVVVYGDASSFGQVVVKNGIVNVKKLILKYTFVPKAWNFISFPTDVDVNAISNLNEKGYYLNNKTAGRGAYYIRSYDTEARAENPTGNVWASLATSKVQGLKGYIMGINNALGMEPVEITFTIDNVALDFESTIRPIHLTLDLTQTLPGSIQEVYIKPANVKGNTLKVNVTFQPEDESELPVNHERALQNMRVTFTPNRRGIRLTLPDQTPAKVAIYDKRGKKLVKAVRYVSPMAIDLTGIESGTYQMVVSYGKASTVQTLEL